MISSESDEAHEVLFHPAINERVPVHGARGKTAAELESEIVRDVSEIIEEREVECMTETEAE